MLYQIFKWAYQDWHTMNITDLRRVTDPTGKNSYALTVEQFKEISGEDFNSTQS